MIQKASTIAMMMTAATYLALLLFGFSVVFDFSFFRFCSLSTLKTMRNRLF